MSMNKQRAALYKLLSHIYILEVDEALLDGIKGLDFPDTDDAIGEGYKLLKEYVLKAGKEDIEDLAVDYARIFLAAGVASGLAAFPYESIYVSKNKLMNQSLASECEKYYAAKGLKARADMYKIPNDHIGLQFEYMAVLCEEDADNSQQKEFFDAHMKRWISTFCADVIKYANTDFYKAIGIITREFIEMEKDLLK